MQIKLSTITVPERLRVASQASVDRIATSFVSIGQQQPIIVRQTGPEQYRLVAGATRLSAARALSWSVIAADTAPDFGDPELNECHDVMVEIDENLMREGLTPLQTGEHELVRKVTVARREARKSVLEAEAKAAREKAETGKVSAKTQNLKDKRSGQETTKLAETGGKRNSGTYTRERAEELQASERTVQRMIQRAEVVRDAAQRAGLDQNALVGTTVDTERELNKLPDLLRTAPQQTLAMLKRAAGGDALATPTRLASALKAQDEAEKAVRRRKGTLAEQAMDDLVADLRKINQAVRALANKATLLAQTHKDGAQTFRDVADTIRRVLVDGATSVAVSMTAGTAVAQKQGQVLTPITDNHTPAGRVKRAREKADQEANNAKTADEIRSHGIR